MTSGYYCAIFPFCGGGKKKKQKTKAFYDWATTLQSAVYILYIVYILYLVCSLQSAFCTKRYPWHQYSLCLVTVNRTTHNVPQNTCV